MQKFNNIGIGIPDAHTEQNPRIDWDSYFMRIAFLTAERSPDDNTKHGCVLVKDKRIIATGYNGFPAGCPDNLMPNNRYNNFKYNAINHAEESSIFDAAIRGISICGATIFLTGHPCASCCRKLVSVGIIDWCISDRPHIHTDVEKLWQQFWKETFNVKVRHWNGHIE